MATMTLPAFVALRAVEDNTRFVDSGLSMAERMQVARRICFSLVTLTLAFRQQVQEQDYLISLLQDDRVQDFTMAQFSDMAERLDHTVALNQCILANAEKIKFRLWHDSMEKIAVQTERLDSLAESFRMSASAAMHAHVSDLVEKAPDFSDATNNWRDFVATLHD